MATLKEKSAKQAKQKKSLTVPSFASIVLLIYLGIAIPLHFVWSPFTMQWFWFGFFFIFIPLAFLNLFVILTTGKPVTDEEKENAAINICKYIGLFWLYDFLYMSIFNQWLICEYVFGLLSVIIIFYNLTQSFLNQHNPIKWMMPFDLIFGVGLSVYLIYIIPDSTLQTIVTAIVSALYGGLLTLIGVAWTIRHTNEEKKENELKAIRPFVYPFNVFNDFDGKQLVTLQFVDESSEKAESKYIGMIKNTDNGILILKELVVDGERFFIKHGDVLDKNGVAQIILFTDKDLLFSKLILIGTDVRGYVAAFNLELNEEKKEIIRITEEQIDG